MSKKSEKKAELEFAKFVAERGIMPHEEKRVKKAKKIYNEIKEREAKLAEHVKALDKIKREVASLELKRNKQIAKIASLQSAKV
ncbi:MAG: hypothetical protein WC455_26760 [Dehalococcoidia bacterium]|jgi:hypothetical protein